MLIWHLQYSSFTFKHYICLQKYMAFLGSFGYLIDPKFYIYCTRHKSFRPVGFCRPTYVRLIVFFLMAYANEQASKIYNFNLYA